MGNIGELIDPEGTNTFLKYDWLFEKQLKKMQSLELFKNYGKFPYSIAEASRTHDCYITLSGLDPVVKKWEQFLHKKLSKICVSDLHVFYVSDFQALTEK